MKEPVKEKLRIDKYLWSIRIFKTRALASEACEKGKVRMLGNALKASKTVNVTVPGQAALNQSQVLTAYTIQ